MGSPCREVYDLNQQSGLFGFLPPLFTEGRGGQSPPLDIATKGGPKFADDAADQAPHNLRARTLDAQRPFLVKFDVVGAQSFRRLPESGKFRGQ